MHRYLLILLIFCSMHTHAQEGEQLNDSLFLTDKPDEEAVMEIIPDTTLIKSKIVLLPDTIATLKAKKQLAYLSSLDSLLKAQQNQDIKKGRRSVSLLDSLFRSSFLKIIFWIIAAGVVLFILFRLFITQGVFKRNPSGKNVEEKPDEEKVFTQSDYSKLVQQSCRLGDYRAAVKYLFLGTLQHLSDNSFIEYSLDKTNYRYLQEIPEDKRKGFARLILNYEYVWYGNIKIELSVFEKIESEFIAFRQHLMN